MKKMDIDITNVNDVEMINDILWENTDDKGTIKLSVLFVGAPGSGKVHFVKNKIRPYILNRIHAIIDLDENKYTEERYKSFAEILTRKLLISHTTDTVNKTLLDDVDIIVNIINKEV